MGGHPREDAAPACAAARARRRARRRRTAGLAAVLAAGALALVAAVGASGTQTEGARIVRFTIDGPLVHQALAVAAAIPPGRTSGARPLLVFLHGKGEDQNSNLDDAMFAALARLGSRAPDIVFPYGGADSYWHDRASGAWGSYVVDELIPRAAAILHGDSTRVAIGGISMGGFGALDLARLHSGRFCAVGGHSAAVFFSGALSAAGAFDDAADFARHGVLAAARAGDPYAGIPVWIDNGTQDPFLAADTALVSALRAHGHAVSFHVWPGGHDQAYWNSHWGSYLQFYAAALASCRPG